MTEKLEEFTGKVNAVFHSGSSTIIEAQNKKETSRFYLDKPENPKIERGKTIALNYYS